MHSFPHASQQPQPDVIISLSKATANCLNKNAKHL